MTKKERAFALNAWHLGSMNDGLFIIDTPPRPSTDEVYHDRKDGPTMVLNITDLPHEKAQAIVDAHNRALHHLVATPAAPPVVTDEMVEAASKASAAYAAKVMSDGRTWPDDYSLSEKVDVRSMMRLALEAALKVKEEGQ